MNTETELEPVDLLAMQRDQIRMNVRKLFLPVALTPEELRDFSERTAQAFTALETEEGREKANRAAWNEEHKARKAEHGRLNKITDDKAEDRMVACGTYGLIETNEVVTVRLDTAKVVGRRAMTKDERSNLLQQPLAFVMPDDDPDAQLSADPDDFDYDDEGEGNELPPEA